MQKLILPVGLSRPMILQDWRGRSGRGRTSCRSSVARTPCRRISFCRPRPLGASRSPRTRSCSSPWNRAFRCRSAEKMWNWNLNFANRYMSWQLDGTNKNQIFTLTAPPPALWLMFFVDWILDSALHSNFRFSIFFSPPPEEEHPLWLKSDKEW